MMFQKYAFRIRNLTRRFNDRIVISVPKLDIERGKFIFLLGNSGCGKSTFLETLGLMSQAYDYSGIKSQIIYYPEPDSIGYEYDYIWVDEDKLNYVRLNYMSFLFQQTNLFPQFTVSENIALSKVMQGFPMSDPKLLEETKKLMEELGIISQANEYPKKQSGGQQQRTAFARARLKNFKVLFADEPTGNLGEKDSKTVATLVRQMIDEHKGEHTAIIVTHDIDLALEYADKLIIMSQDGFIDIQNVFSSVKEKDGKRTWPQLGNDENGIKKYVQTVMDKIYGEDIKAKLDEDYIEVEHNYPNIPKKYDREFKKFYHKIKFNDLSLKNITSITLTAVLFVVWLAIGFSNGSLKYLKEKMSDPFIKWITVVVPSSSQEKIPMLFDSLSSPIIKKKYSIQKLSGYNRFALFFYNENKKGTFASFGRNIEIDDPILDKIMDKNNLIKGGKFKTKKDYGLIVTENFLDRFSQKNSVNDFVKLSFMVDSTEYLIPIPIRAVVKNLPGKSEFISTTFFWRQRFFDSMNPFNPRYTKELIIYTKPESKGWVLHDSLKSFFYHNLAKFQKLHPFVSRPNSYDESLNKGAEVSVSFMKNLGLKKINDIYLAFKKSKEGRNFKMVRLNRFRFGNDRIQKSYDNISINVSSLDNLSGLKDYLFKRFGLEVDMARIESLKNYNFIAKLTSILSIAIIIISLISVSIFVSYLLYTHLYKNRIYIGSFTAFGITDGTMQMIYLRRMSILIISALIISLVLSFLAGYTGLLSKFLNLFIPMESGKSYFDLVNLYPLIFLIVLGISSYFSLYKTAKYFLDHSPGDLIYDRIGPDRTSPPVHIQRRIMKKRAKQEKRQN